MQPTKETEKTADADGTTGDIPLLPWSKSLRADAALDAHVDSDVVLEVRRGKVKPLPGLRVMSGIDKGLVEGPIAVTEMGIVGDEHDYTFHGGVDKAIHGYCAAHYAAWGGEYPEAAARFRPGGFGENLVFGRLNERNVCIGDVWGVGRPGSGVASSADEDEGIDGTDTDGAGDRLLLEVSLPRQPCFKLSHRFGVRHFPARTWQTSRTGWYYRVKRTGRVQAGDVARLVARPHPEWPVARVQEYLHRQQQQKADLAIMEELAGLGPLGAESRDMFRGRLAKRLREAQRRETAEAAETTGNGYRAYRIVEKRRETARIVALVLAAVEPDADAQAIDAGSHVRLKLATAQGELVRTYSVVGGRDANRFELGVAYDPPTSRGGSKYLHEAAVGTTVQAGHMALGVPRVSASHQVFVAGGVGLTAFLARLEELRRIHYSCELHYAVRAAEAVPFRARLAALEDKTDNEVREAGDPPVVHYYRASAGERLDIDSLFRSLPWNTHVSVCGPPRMMAAAQQAAKAAGLAAGDVHYEAFAADEAGGDPFAVDVLHEGNEQTLHVGSEDTLLGVLRRTFGQTAVESSCEAGNCGTCRVTLRSGRVEHRGTGLGEGEKADTLLACVSRGVGRIAVEL